MVLGFNLPDWKSSLQEAFQSYVQTPLERKSAEFKQLVQENMEQGQRTQKVLIAIAFAIFLLLLIAYFWKD